MLYNRRTGSNTCSFCVVQLLIHPKKVEFSHFRKKCTFASLWPKKSNTGGLKTHMKQSTRVGGEWSEVTNLTLFDLHRCDYQHVQKAPIPNRTFYADSAEFLHNGPLALVFRSCARHRKSQRAIDHKSYERSFAHQFKHLLLCGIKYIQRRDNELAWRNPTTKR